MKRMHRRKPRVANTISARVSNSRSNQTDGTSETPPVREDDQNILHPTDGLDTPSLEGDEMNVNEEVDIEDSNNIPPTTKKIHICPIGDSSFDPSNRAVREMWPAMTRNWKGPWVQYGKVPKHEKEAWWSRWKNYFTWDSNHDARIRKNYHKRAGKRFSDNLGDAVNLSLENGGKSPDWIADRSHWQEILRIKATPEAIRRSEIAAKNRAMQQAKSTSGSQTFFEVKKHMGKELGREAEPAELYLRTHRGDISEKGRNTLATYNAERERLTQEGQTSTADLFQLWANIVGVRYGTVFGVGDAVDITDWGSDSTSSSQLSQSQKLQMIETLQAKLDTQDEKLHSQDEKLTQIAAELRVLSEAVASLTSLTNPEHAAELTIAQTHLRRILTHVISHYADGNYGGTSIATMILSSLIYIFGVR